MNKNDLRSFVEFGYFFTSNDKVLFDHVVEKIELPAEREELKQLAYNNWMYSVEQDFLTSCSHTVPISGGIDSRAILAALIKFTDVKNIKTYTFGTPGTLDYEIGNKVAKKLGTTHVNFDLTKQKYTLNDLYSASKFVDHKTVLFHHPNIRTLVEETHESLVWSGFMGDPLAGSKLKAVNSRNRLEAQKKYLLNNRYIRDSYFKNNYDHDYEKLLSYDDNLTQLLTHDENIDFFNRQTGFIKPHVLMSCSNYRTPFLNKSWTNFCLNLPREERIEQKLYNEMLFSYFSKEFSIETKNSNGAGLFDSNIEKLYRRAQAKINRLFNPRKRIYTNYIDFSSGIREREDLRIIIKELIRSIDSRYLGIDIEAYQLYKEHINNVSDHSDILLTLSSLELHIRNGLNYEN